jgi:transposase-like protein
MLGLTCIPPKVYLFLYRFKGHFPKDYKLRRVKYLNYLFEQDHRFIKEKVRAPQCFKSLHTAERTLGGLSGQHDT